MKERSREDIFGVEAGTLPEDPGVIFALVEKTMDRADSVKFYVHLERALGTAADLNNAGIDIFSSHADVARDLVAIHHLCDQYFSDAGNVSGALFRSLRLNPTATNVKPDPRIKTGSFSNYWHHVKGKAMERCKKLDASGKIADSVERGGSKWNFSRPKIGDVPNHIEKIFNLVEQKFSRAEAIKFYDALSSALFNVLEASGSEPPRKMLEADELLATHIDAVEALLELHDVCARSFCDAGELSSAVYRSLGLAPTATNVAADPKIPTTVSKEIWSRIFELSCKRRDLLKTQKEVQPIERVDDDVVARFHEWLESL
jgi:hypothetical protein